METRRVDDSVALTAVGTRSVAGNALINPVFFSLLRFLLHLTDAPAHLHLLIAAAVTLSLQTLNSVPALLFLARRQEKYRRGASRDKAEDTALRQHLYGFSFLPLLPTMASAMR